MDFQFYLEKLFASEQFGKFKKERSSAYLCSAFFSIDKKEKDNQQHMDFHDPEGKKVFSFKLEGDMEPIELENYDKNIPEKLRDNLNFSFEDVEHLIRRKMQEEELKNEVQKLLYSVQMKDSKPFIVGTVFISGMGLIKVLIDIDNKKIESFEKKSFMDMFKIVRKK